MKKAQDFSIVMATYTGVDTIDATFSSLLKQQDPKVNYEMIVVIDGPNKVLREKVDNAAISFKESGIPFKVEQFTKNKGRFEARLAGAKLAKYPYILIVDDRIELPDNSLKIMSSIGEEAIIPDVLEKPPRNYASFTLNRMRRKIYGARWNTDFEPYYIDKDNFDSSPKGTATFWVNRKKFIGACEVMSVKGGNTKNFNEDTRIMRYLIEEGVKIYKTSELRLEYEARASAKEELLHIYHRTPRFIDYYFRPGRRYFWPLVIFYIALIPFLILLIFLPILMALILLASLILSFWVSKSVKEWPKVFAGLWVVSLYFGIGLVLALKNKLMAR